MRFRRLLGLAAVLFVPIRVLDLLRVVASDSATEVSGPTALFESGWGFVIVALQAVALSLLGICTGVLVVRMVEGGDASFRELLGIAARRLWVAPVIVACSVVIRSLMACLGGVGWFFGDALLFVASVVAGAEGLGPIAAVRRSVALTRRDYGRMLAVCLGALVVTYLLRGIFYWGPYTLAVSFAPSELVLDLIDQAGALVVVVAEPLTACIAARAYLDLRCRTEAFDLTRRIGLRFGGAV